MKSSFLLCICIMIIRPAFAQSPADASHAARLQRIENGLLPPIIVTGRPSQTMTLKDRMEYYHVPGVSVAFVEHGKISWTRCYGFADVAAKEPVTPQTLFQAASISKPVSALAALHLVEQGKLSLDEDVNVKLKAWKVPENKYTSVQKVTLRRLLGHNAGTTVHGFAGYENGTPVPSVVQVLNGEKPANSPAVVVDTVPGDLVRYSGGGYTIMQLLLTDVAQEPFPKILHDLVLQPAGMTDSKFEQPLSADNKQPIALPYNRDGKPIKGGPHTYPELAAAGLWTTPSDLCKLAIEMQKEREGVSNTIISKEMAREMLPNDNRMASLGFGTRTAGDRVIFNHGGQNEGYSCDIEAYTGLDGCAIVIMTNGDAGGGLVAELLRSIAQEYGLTDMQAEKHTAVNVDVTELNAYTGKYILQGVDNPEVLIKNGKLYVQTPTFGKEPLELVPESDTQFFILQRPIRFEFKKDDAGKLYLNIVAFGRSYDFKKTE